MWLVIVGDSRYNGVIFIGLLGFFDLVLGL